MDDAGLYVILIISRYRICCFEAFQALHCVVAKSLQICELLAPTVVGFSRADSYVLPSF